MLIVGSQTPTTSPISTFDNELYKLRLVSQSHPQSLCRFPNNATLVAFDDVLLVGDYEDELGGGHCGLDS